MELICQGLITEREQRQDLGVALPLGMWQIRTSTLQLCDYVYSDRGEQCGTCKTWPGKARRKPESAADTVRYLLITHLVASRGCCGSHPLFSGLLLTENCHCLHPHMPAVFTLLPIRSLKEGSFVCCCRGVVSHHVMPWFSLMRINLAVIWVNLPTAVNESTTPESGVEKAKVHKWCFRHQRRPRREASCTLVREPLLLAIISVFWQDH